ncbi:uncharacterized oxidoreductase At4g09670-like [Prosopis cineraria]|uniref:uncharacterized oxidoreductase At4g09670-like n=1 Tax=Prosopis cineraria TaxID=364024 RepID=UPI00240F8610|nr:uncharacterized oxidoreductase At4g09670-like [Prosopis cineraria]
MANDQTTVRFGILGCAQIAIKLCKAISQAPNATLVAIGSRSVEKASQFAADNGLPETVRVYGSYEGVLEDSEVDAVYMPLPTALHVKWAVMTAKKRKHVLLEKPVAMNVSELDQILEACETNGVQFMDGTMWMHHPRTQKMKEVLSDAHRFGQLKLIHSCAAYNPGPEFLTHSIRVKPDLDGLGALGDIGWYCIRAILWAVDYDLPATVLALPGAVRNDAGVILSCGASLHWPDGRLATFHCSFLSYLSLDVTALGTKGYLRLHDFIIPFDENSGYGFFWEASQVDFGKLAADDKRWCPEANEHKVESEEAQEVLMVMEFSRLVEAVESGGATPEKSWGVVSRKTQVVVDAVKESIEGGYKTVELIVS